MQECPSTSIGWTARRDQEVIFKGNERVKANSVLQCEGLAVLRGIQEAQAQGLEHIKILTNSLSLVQALVKKTSPFHLVNICHDIVEICKNFGSCLIIKVDRGLVGDSHDLAT